MDSDAEGIRGLLMKKHLSKQRRRVMKGVAAVMVISMVGLFMMGCGKSSSQQPEQTPPPKETQAQPKESPPQTPPSAPPPSDQLSALQKQLQEVQRSLAENPLQREERLYQKTVEQIKDSSVYFPNLKIYLRGGGAAVEYEKGQADALRQQMYKEYQQMLLEYYKGQNKEGPKSPKRSEEKGEKKPAEETPKKEKPVPPTCGPKSKK